MWRGWDSTSVSEELRSKSFCQTPNKTSHSITSVNEWLMKEFRIGVKWLSRQMESAYCTILAETTRSVDRYVRYRRKPLSIYDAPKTGESS